MATRAEFQRSQTAILLLLAGAALLLWGPRPEFADASAAQQAKDIASSAVEAARAKALAAAHGIRGTTKAVADEVRNKLTYQPNFMVLQGNNERNLAEGTWQKHSEDKLASTKPDFLFVESVDGGSSGSIRRRAGKEDDRGEEEAIEIHTPNYPQRLVN